MQIVFITDLDGTLLGHEDFDFTPIKPAIDELIEAGTTLILASSKTEAEIERVCDDFGRRLPFIYENGAGFAHFDDLHDAVSEDTVRLVHKGLCISEISTKWVEAIPHELRQLCTFLDKMDTPSQETLLGLRGAELDRALTRLYSCLFVFTGNSSQFAALNAQTNKAGLSVQRGGRVCTLSGHHNKAVYLPEIRRLTQQGKEPSVLVGFGDSENDREMLNAVDIACVIPRPDGHTLSVQQAGQSLIIAPCIAPWGWQEAAMKALSLLSERRNSLDRKGVSYG